MPLRFIVELSSHVPPIVLVDSAVFPGTIDAVEGDDRGGARKLAEHVLGHGHTRVAVIGGPKAWVSNRERCGGFAEALPTARVKPLAVLHADATTHDTGYALARQALSFKPAAILAINDAMALGALDAVRDAGLTVPGDAAVTGVDDIEPAAHSSEQSIPQVDSPLPSAAPPYRDLAR